MLQKFVLFFLSRRHLICVFGSETNEIQSVSVMKGESVLLHTDLTEVRRHDDILWKFGAVKSLIAKINREAGVFSTYDDVPDGRFRDRLKLDNQTGSLTITNISTEHAGLYEVKMITSQLSPKTFNVSVYEVNHCCGPTEAAIRLVLSVLVGVATVTVLIYDVRSRRRGKKTHIIQIVTYLLSFNL